LGYIIHPRKADQFNKTMTDNNFLFVPGPTFVPGRIQRAMSRSIEDHRAPQFAELFLPLLEDIKKIFQTRSGNVLIYPGSGSAGWEASMTNTLSPGDKVLIPVYGEFCRRWANMANKQKLNVLPILTEWGNEAPAETVFNLLEEDVNKEIKAVFIVHNETSTGVVTDVAAIRRALDDAQHPALLFVDGVSSIGGMHFAMDQWAVDIAVCGSQKCLMLPPGLALIGISQKARKATLHARCPRAYFDFSDMFQANGDGYYPFTPPVNLLHGLRESINMILEEGLEQVFHRHYRMAKAVQAAVHAWGLELCAQSRKTYSNTVSAIVLPESINAAEIIQQARKHYDLYLGAGLGPLEGKVFRIGHLGTIHPLTLSGAICGVELVLQSAGLSINIGAGISAALDSLSKSTDVSQLNNCRNHPNMAYR
jgi:alanine-glyoxylate transaminase/serine-glyoxylate transaminase/serine-pyruvate transaminase